MKLWQKILLCVVAVELLGSLGGLLTASSIKDWYDSLTKPPGTPPNWLFGPVWTILYAMMGISFALVWHHDEKGALKRKAYVIFAVQFLLNLAWTPLFFGAHLIGTALIVISLLLASIFLTIRRFRPIDRTASLLLVPYFLWVGYATYLNAGYWLLNR
ncbi:TspO/MBR family protein [Haloferula chungangensis]|uniref:TspO/MBR family protein n=1 Tax=Haloferula chungangensis TaxID=1048331 RepID=A0ABW2L2C5_9BACT